MPGLWILNFSHPLTPEQKKTIRTLTGQRISKVLDLKCQFDPQQPFAEQMRRLLDQLNLDYERWQSLSILINPPSFAPIACLLMAELHGRTGHFPAILRLRPTNDVPPQFEVAEIINLQKIRDEARQLRIEKCGQGDQGVDEAKRAH